MEKLKTVGGAVAAVVLVIAIILLIVGKIPIWTGSLIAALAFARLT